MPLSLLSQPDRVRVRYETDLRERGFVPLTSFDVSSPALHKALPSCAVRQVVPDQQPHGRVVWTHPGPSGLDPRAVGPLSLVRVADGLGPDPLDEPMTLGRAIRWLLTRDVTSWLTRRRHRTAFGSCLVDGPTCLMHPLADPVSQQVADALGDRSLDPCQVSTPLLPWSQGRTRPYEQAIVAASALHATWRLGDWCRAGVPGHAAWDLTVHDVPLTELQRWHLTGFTTEEVALWSRSPIEKAARMRPRDLDPYRPLELPPGGPPASKDRGLHWYAQWQLARHGRRAEIRICGCCGARDQQDPCRTCRAEGRGAPVDREWSSYSGFAAVHPAYADVEVGRRVRCGDRKCQTPLALSAADEGVRL